MCLGIGCWLRWLGSAGMSARSIRERRFSTLHPEASLKVARDGCGMHERNLVMCGSELILWEGLEFGLG